MEKKITSAFLLFLGIMHYSQTGNVGINTTDPKTTLDIMGVPTDATKLDGLIAPRLTGDQLRAKNYTSSQTGALVYVTAADSSPSGQTINVTSPSYYYFDGLVWQITKSTDGGIEPWQVMGGTTKATDNNQNIYQIGNVNIGSSAAEDPLLASLAPSKLNVTGVFRQSNQPWQYGTGNPNLYINGINTHGFASPDLNTVLSIYSLRNLGSQDFFNPQNGSQMLLNNSQGVLTSDVNFGNFTRLSVRQSDGSNFYLAGKSTPSNTLGGTYSLNEIYTANNTNHSGITVGDDYDLNLAARSSISGNYESVIGLGNQNGIQFKFNNNGSNIGTNYQSYIFPRVSGSIGQVLTVATAPGNGTSTLTWTSPAIQDLRLVGTSSHITVDAGTGGTGTSLGGVENIAIGKNAMTGGAFAGGDNNIAIGTNALPGGLAVSNNIGIGKNVMVSNSIAGSNIGIGNNTLGTLSDGGGFNVAVGENSGTGTFSGSQNTFLGANSKTSADVNNSVAIGYNSVVGASNTIALGGTGADAVNVAIGKTTAGSTLDVTGSFALPIRTGSGLLTDKDYTIIATGNVNLPSPIGATGRMYRIIYRSLNVNINGLIEVGGTLTAVYGLNASVGGRGVTLQSDGNRWVVIASL